MRIVVKVAVTLLVLGLVAVVGIAAWLAVAPPSAIRVAAGYTAKIVCSNVFVAGRNPDAVLRVDVQAPGHPLLRLMSVDVDRDARRVDAALFGVFGRSSAVAREGLGCASIPDGDMGRSAEVALPPGPQKAPVDALWPEGNRVEASAAPDLLAILGDPAMTGLGLRALVVVHDGRIVGERYADGFSADTPLIGWSMTKTVNAAIIGTLIARGKLSLDATALLPQWRQDARRRIRLADLLAMSSGLVFNEDYGNVTDVTRMLYLEPDMAGYAAAKPLAGAPGQLWSYSSGTAEILSRIWQSSLADPQAALAWPSRALFEPLGMTSAVLETDETGTFVGSSYLYATARDWARFGQFLLADGVWNAARILPPGFVSWMFEPVAASGGVYGRGQIWLKGPDAGTPPDAGYALPADTVWMIGHDGQSVAIIPSHRLVVARLGLTPARLGYKPQRLVEALSALLQIHEPSR